MDNTNIEQYALRNHGISSSESDSDSSSGGRSDFDEQYEAYRPPPVCLEDRKHDIIKIAAFQTVVSKKFSSIYKKYEKASKVQKADKPKQKPKLPLLKPTVKLVATKNQIKQNKSSSGFPSKRALNQSEVMPLATPNKVPTKSEKAKKKRDKKAQAKKDGLNLVTNAFENLLLAENTSTEPNVNSGLILNDVKDDVICSVPKLNQKSETCTGTEQPQKLQMKVPSLEKIQILNPFMNVFENLNKFNVSDKPGVTEVVHNKGSAVGDSLSLTVQDVSSLKTDLGDQKLEFAGVIDVAARKDQVLHSFSSSERKVEAGQEEVSGELVPTVGYSFFYDHEQDQPYLCANEITKGTTLTGNQGQDYRIVKSRHSGTKQKAKAKSRNCNDIVAANTEISMLGQEYSEVSGKSFGIMNGWFDGWDESFYKENKEYSNIVDQEQNYSIIKFKPKLINSSSAKFANCINKEPKSLEKSVQPEDSSFYGSSKPDENNANLTFTTKPKRSRPRRRRKAKLVSSHNIEQEWENHYTSGNLFPAADNWEDDPLFSTFQGSLNMHQILDEPCEPVTKNNANLTFTTKPKRSRPRRRRKAKLVNPHHIEQEWENHYTSGNLLPAADNWEDDPWFSTYQSSLNMHQIQDDPSEPDTENNENLTFTTKSNNSGPRSKAKTKLLNSHNIELANDDWENCYASRTSLLTTDDYFDEPWFTNDQHRLNMDQIQDEPSESRTENNANTTITIKSKRSKTKRKSKAKLLNSHNNIEVANDGINKREPISSYECWEPDTENNANLTVTTKSKRSKTKRKRKTKLPNSHNIELANNDWESPCVSRTSLLTMDDCFDEPWFTNDQHRFNMEQIRDEPSAPDTDNNANLTVTTKSKCSKTKRKSKAKLLNSHNVELANDEWRSSYASRTSLLSMDDCLDEPWFTIDQSSLNTVQIQNEPSEPDTENNANLTVTTKSKRSKTKRRKAKAKLLNPHTNIELANDGISPYEPWFTNNQSSLNMHQIQDEPSESDTENNANRTFSVKTKRSKPRRKKRKAKAKLPNSQNKQEELINYNNGKWQHLIQSHAVTDNQWLQAHRDYSSDFFDIAWFYERIPDTYYFKSDLQASTEHEIIGDTVIYSQGFKRNGVLVIDIPTIEVELYTDSDDDYHCTYQAAIWTTLMSLINYGNTFMNMNRHCKVAEAIYRQPLFFYLLILMFRRLSNQN